MHESLTDVGKRLKKNATPMIGTFDGEFFGWMGEARLKAQIAEAAERNENWEAQRAAEERQAAEAAEAAQKVGAKTQKVGTKKGRVEELEEQQAKRQKRS